MKPNISFLIGSGFSLYEGIPGVPELNKRMRRIEESEIMIHSSQIAIYLRGKKIKIDGRMKMKEYFYRIF